MGIFSFLSKDKEYVTIEPAVELDMKAYEEDYTARASTAVAPFPDISEGVAIEITDEQGMLLNSGVIHSCNRRELVMGRHPGGLSFKVCEPGTPVGIRGCDKKMAQFTMRATVVESTRVQMKLKDLEPEVHENHRENFRLTVNAPMSIYFINDERYERPEKCTLVDISTGGCCFESDYLHGEGEVLRLRIKLDEYVPMDLVGEVIRVTECGPSKFRCGILFAELKKDESEMLTKTLFNLQLGNKQQHSRVKGHW